jgi:uroporphyrinogen III methyltransferase/synthase
MGVGNLPKISAHLIEHGRPPDTPVAVIHRGTVSAQRTVVGTLEDIAERVRKEALKPPAVIVVGEIVNLRKELAWFERRPLLGKTIVVTRAREQASDFLAVLSGLGAACIEFPTIEIIPAGSWEALDQRVLSLEQYHWLLFTSVNGVKCFFQRLEVLGKDARDLKGLKIGAIGPKTAMAVSEKGIRPDLVPDEYRAEAVVAAFQKLGAKGKRVLLPRAAQAREILPQELEKMGARVDVVEAYRTVKPEGEKGRIAEMFESGDIDMVTFTSSSTVTNFVEIFEKDDEGLQRWMKNVAVACIGPITAKTAKEKGLPVSIVPSAYTIEALTDSVVAYFDSIV